MLGDEIVLFGNRFDRRAKSGGPTTALIPKELPMPSVGAELFGQHLYVATSPFSVIDVATGLERKLPKSDGEFAGHVAAVNDRWLTWLGGLGGLRVARQPVGAEAFQEIEVPAGFDALALLDDQLFGYPGRDGGLYALTLPAGEWRLVLELTLAAAVTSNHMTIHRGQVYLCAGTALVRFDPRTGTSKTLPVVGGCSSIATVDERIFFWSGQAPGPTTTLWRASTDLASAPVMVAGPDAFVDAFAPGGLRVDETCAWGAVLATAGRADLYRIAITAGDP